MSGRVIWITGLSGSGKFKIDKDFEDIDYLIEKKKNKISFKANLNVKNTKFEFIIKFADLFFEESAITLKKRLEDEYNLKDINIKKMSKNLYRVYKGPFYNLGSIKNVYNEIANINFENIELIKL